MSLTAATRAADFVKLQRKLEHLTGKVARQASREAVTKASRPLAREAKAKAPVDSGTLKRSLKVKVKTFKREQVVIGYVGPDRKVKEIVDGKTRQPVRYAHLVEFGSGEKSPQPYLRPAFDSKKQEAIDIYTKEVGPALMRVAKRLGQQK